MPGIHQASPMYNPYSGAAALATVSPAGGEVLDGNTYGNTPKATLVSIPIRYKHELRKAYRSSSRALETRIPARPAIASSGKMYPHTCSENSLAILSWSRKLTIVMIAVNATTAHQIRRPNSRDRCCKSPFVFNTTQ